LVKDILEKIIDIEKLPNNNYRFLCKGTGLFGFYNIKKGIITIPEHLGVHYYYVKNLNSEFDKKQNIKNKIMIKKYKD